MRLTMVFSCLLLLLCPAIAVAADTFVVTPAEIALHHRFDRVQVLVTAAEKGAVTERSLDLTREAKITSADPAIVRVEEGGMLHAVADGQTHLRIVVGQAAEEVPVVVQGVAATEVEFSQDIVPILDKAGCASAACHASQHGKGGFKLSVFGYDPAADYEMIARAGRQRRLNFANPDLSLFLRKPAMGVSHGGGLRIEPSSTEYHSLREWVAQGAVKPDPEAPKVVNMQVTPARRVGQVDQTQQLRVMVTYDDETTRDVTAIAKFDPIDDGVVQVDNVGLATILSQGQTSVMVRYAGQAEVSTFVVPYSDSVKLAGWQNKNFIDELAEKKFRELGIEPSLICDDATFIRRAFFDAIGTLPSPEETTAFIESTEPNKREELIDRLLGLTGDPAKDIYNDQYAAYWTLKWSDLIANNSRTLGEQGMWAMHNWIKESFRTNRPFNDFVSELVTAKGSIYSSGPANYFRINANSTALTESTAQLFLGVRLECAKCHHHPFEKYSQADYYGLAAFFSRVGTKNSEEFGLFGRESIVMVRSSGEVSHPRTRQRMTPTPLGGEPIDDPLDRRNPLAKWLTSPDNEFFSRSVVNRYVAYLLGRGLVEPVDDMRSTNPPSNKELMQALAQHFVDSKFDLKQLIRAIMTSRLYQLSSQPTAENVADRRFYSHYLVKRLYAEPLLDAVDQVTQSQTKFKSLPLGAKAIELPDAEYPNYFLTTFAKPRRVSVCECERAPDENLAQALHTLNGDTLATKIADTKGRVARLIKEKKPHVEIVRELYIAALCRPPSGAELAYSETLLADSSSPKECYEDLLWALMNSKQFLYVR